MSPPPKRDQIKYENTPPPSPEAEADDADDDLKPREIDLEGINDDIVEAVIIQLQKTGNRPHLVKELAAILAAQVKIVETYVAVYPLHGIHLTSLDLRTLQLLYPRAFPHT